MSDSASNNSDDIIDGPLHQETKTASSRKEARSVGPTSQGAQKDLPSARFPMTILNTSATLHRDPVSSFTIIWIIRANCSHAQIIARLPLSLAHLADRPFHTTHEVNVDSEQADGKIPDGDYPLAGQQEFKMVLVMAFGEKLEYEKECTACYSSRCAFFDCRILLEVSPSCSNCLFRHNAKHCSFCLFILFSMI